LTKSGFLKFLQCEKGCNKEMGERDERFREFYQYINDRMYDLMEVFRKGFYVHKDFQGSASLKYVLPVMVPELSYKELDIQEGGTASNRWGKMLKSEMEEGEKEKLRENERFG